MPDVPDDVLDPPERDLAQERLDYLEATADQYNDEQKEREYEERNRNRSCAT